MILGPSGQNIYPEEIEAKLNNLPYVAESLVVERENKLVALVYPDFAALEASGLTAGQLPQIMDDNKGVLNKQVANYERISSLIIVEKEFEKTPKKSIKRFLYTAKNGAIKKVCSVLGIRNILTLPACNRKGTDQAVESV